MTTTAQLFRLLNTFVAPMVKAGVGNPLPVGGGSVVVETIGRVSGQVREVPLLSMRLGDQMVVSTIRGDSQWLSNLEADDRCAVWLFGHRRTARAVTIERGPISIVVLDLGDDSTHSQSADGD
jgi:hypothetical protein